MPNDDDFRKQDGRCPVIRVDDGCRCILKADHEHSYAGPSHCFEAKPKLGPLRPAPKPDPEPASLQADLRALSVVVTDIRALLTDIRSDMRHRGEKRGGAGERINLEEMEEIMRQHWAAWKRQP